MPGRTHTTWGKTWKSAETRVIRVPAGLANDLLKWAHAVEDGAEIKVIPAPDLFSQPKKRNKRVTDNVPHGTKPEKPKPVTRTKKPRVSPKNP